MMMMVHHDNRGRPDQRCDGGDGPTCNRPPGVAEPAAGSSSSSSGGSVLRCLQPFQYLSNTNTHHHTSTALRSPGGMTTAALDFPFTNQQWKELERQAMIYKYMMASIPVPRDLLFPTTTASASASVSQSPLSGGGFNLRLSNSKDPEPGRCKRTDGKKWRCSRDVAPNQKYCERHMHRGRPRSRKHVEIHASNTTSTTTTIAKRVRRDNNNSNNIRPISPPTISNPSHEMSKNGYPTQFFGSSLQPFHQTQMYLDKAGVKSAPFGGGVNSVSSDREVRGVEWMMKTEATPMSSSDAQWHDMMQSKTELSCSRIPYFDANSSVFGQRSEEECFLNLNSYTNFNAGDGHHQQQGNDCNMFLNPDVVALENPLLEETPRSFIDAWSKNDNGDNNNNSSLPSSGKLSPSSLTLSMGGYNSISDEMGQTQMSLGCNHGSGNGIKPRVSTWLTPASWVPSPPGGPLAEVLKPTTSAASNPSSPITTNGNHGEFSSPLGTTVSSPSGVLQKTFASFSDSSGNSSPNLRSSKAKIETVSLWSNQSNA
ncbi:putative transcription factor interactor and regulator C3H-WRC/GRF family [Rosa chinensis]|uniref:Growth-regulating factor n=1 Tax=Rosa chinensis TaxID=74649 RepID=A0A2P6SPE7_ROSCH|nr:growth-regulating factor 4 [Rosa chinensis]PRQ60564.1 putative transcription factor interactor and regulator C3H-WRC/GRF family [Rosa chinensis]